eukprot:10842773-Lingulodinium_polyedra.AAC.1
MQLLRVLLGCELRETWINAFGCVQTLANSGKAGAGIDAAPVLRPWGMARRTPKALTQQRQS